MRIGRRIARELLCHRVERGYPESRLTTDRMAPAKRLLMQPIDDRTALRGGLAENWDRSARARRFRGIMTTL